MNEMMQQFAAESEEIRCSMDNVRKTVSDIKTAVSEAVTNAVIHGYDGAFSTSSIPLPSSDISICTTSLSSLHCSFTFPPSMPS